MHFTGWNHTATHLRNTTLIYEFDYKENRREIIEIPSEKVDENLIVDLNGAGDGFAGGFFTGILLNLDLYHSGLLGNKIASEIIKLKGFQIPYVIGYSYLKEFVNSSSSQSRNFASKKLDL